MFILMIDDFIKHKALKSVQLEWRKVEWKGKKK
ncbi:MAG: hypothetical protein K0R54_4745 [Clostridiaceae bacterium]|jgi:hypothetical protein|nr:hypothetical protein [Clostridiaceae bacterium]